MVRLMCQNCPRSCCGEGEKVDQIRAEKAVTALFKPEAKKMTFGTFFNENESSNDSITMELTSESIDSDSDSEHLYIVINDKGPNSDDSNDGNNSNGHEQAKDKRKERRRERNKRSAQAYRQRRRQQMSEADETLHSLLEKNHVLRQKIDQLEEEKAIVMNLLKTKIKIPWPYPVYMPYPTGIWSNQGGTMSTQIGMDSVVQEVTVAS